MRDLQDLVAKLRPVRLTNFDNGAAPPAFPVTTSGWNPLLQGAQAAPAWDLIVDIAGKLAEHVATLQTSDETDPHDLSLANGMAGLTLFFGYLQRATGEERWRDLATQCITHAVAGIDSAPLPACLLDGYTGIGWAWTHLDQLWEQEQPAKSAGEDPLAAMDEVVLELVSVCPWRGPCDLSVGLVGYGVYGLERLPRPAAGDIVAAVCTRLIENAREMAEGYAWLTPARHLGAEQRRQHPDGHFDLGVSHGVPGIIAFLSSAMASGHAPPETGKTLDGAVNWLLARQLPPSAPCRFPWTHVPGLTPRPARLAWCYGDPGVCAALAGAAAAAGRMDWWTRASACARGTTRRSAADGDVSDVSLCHGAAGLGHLYNRFYQQSGDPAFATAGREWLGRALGYRLPTEMFPGYEELARQEWIAAPGLMIGAVGVGLALLAAVSKCVPSWDRVLLMSH